MFRTTLIPLTLIFSMPSVPAQDGADGSAESAERKRPNILVIVGDDHAADALGCAGHPFLETPALDGLAAEGVRFTSAFTTTALCSPSRASLWTGRYARQHGVLDDNTLFPSDLPTVFSALADVGYETGFIGKWHMGSSGWARPPFDYHATFEGEGEYEGCLFKVGELTRRAEGFVDDAIANYALEYLRRDHDRPFILTVAFRASSGPRIAREHLQERYADARLGWPENVGALPPYPNSREFKGLAKARRGAKLHRMKIGEDWALQRAREPFETTESYMDGRGSRRQYFRLVSGLDENVGQVLRALELFGLRDDTIVVYIADNGMMNGAHSLSGSGSAYEESMHIPWIVRHPGLERSGVEVDELVLNVDLMPTLLDWAGVDVPEDVSGRSVAPLVAGEPVDDWRQAFVYEYWRNGQWSANVPDHIALRTRDFKLVEYPEYPRWRQLFDLGSDPLETLDLARDAGYLEQLLELRQSLAEHEDAIGPRVP